MIDIITPIFDQSSPVESKKYAHEIGKRFIELQTDLGDTSEAGSHGGNYNVAFINFEGLEQGTQYYIRLGYFLEFLQNTIIPAINNDGAVRLLKVDYDELTNLIYSPPQQVSSNPLICIFKSTYRIYYSWGETLNIFDFLPGTFIRSDNFEANYGQIMNVYINMDFILNEIESNKDNQGKISLYTLLNSICQGWNKSTGDFNTLEPIIDSEENIIRIVDSVTLPDRDEILKELNLDASTETAYFDTFRYGTYTLENKTKVPHAGFIRDLSFNTTVGSNMATMITVGSTYRGYVVGEDSTCLSRMNAGLVDRFKETISYPEYENNYDEPESLSERYAGAIVAFDNYIKNLNEYIWEKDVVDDYSSLQTQLLEYEQAYQVELASQEEVDKDKTTNQSTLPASANSGFLPFDLSLTMDGLSGMKIYQKFSADTNFLPTNYPESLEFIIKGITNTIADNQWITNIESFAIVRNPYAISGSARENNGNTGTSDGSGDVTNNYSPNSSTFSNIKFYARAKNDRINPTLLEDINTAAKNAGLTVTITTAVTGHDKYTSSGNISSHWKGIGVDVAEINDIGSNNATNATNGNATFRSNGNKLKDALVALGYVWNTESGQQKAVLWQTNTGGNHFNHLHISRKT